MTSSTCFDGGLFPSYWTWTWKSRTTWTSSAVHGREIFRSSRLAHSHHRQPEGNDFKHVLVRINESCGTTHAREISDMLIMPYLDDIKNWSDKTNSKTNSTGTLEGQGQLWQE